ncbi:hypothetical protein N310_12778, partial [Acanthisitta chloris]
DYPELADSLHQLLGAEEAKPCPQGTESVAMSRDSHLATGVTQGGSSCHPEVSSASASSFPRARPSLSEEETLICRAADGGDAPHRVSCWFLSSEEQQETILAGSHHDAHVGYHRQSLGGQSPFPSTPELLRPQTPPSPGSALRSRSVLSLSALSSEENGLS